jgi:hypothetical protein
MIKPIQQLNRALLETTRPNHFPASYSKFEEPKAGDRMREM